MNLLCIISLLLCSYLADDVNGRNINGVLDYGNDGYGNYGDPPVPDLPDHITKNPKCGCSKKTKTTEQLTTECIHTTGEISTPKLTSEAVTEISSTPPNPISTNTELPTSKPTTAVPSEVPIGSTKCPGSESGSESDSSDSSSSKSDGSSSSETGNGGSSSSGTGNGSSRSSGTANGGSSSSGTGNGGSSSSGTANGGSSSSGTANGASSSSGTANDGSSSSGTANDDSSSSGTGNGVSSSSGTANGASSSSGTGNGASSSSDSSSDGSSSGSYLRRRKREMDDSEYTGSLTGDGIGELLGGYIDSSEEDSEVVEVDTRGTEGTTNFDDIWNLDEDSEDWYNYKCFNNVTENVRKNWREAEIGNICTVSGSINYRTYDDVALHFTGTCKYVLSGVANEKIGQGYPGWRVLVSNQRITDGGWGENAVTKYIEVQVDSYFIRVYSDRRVLVNNCLTKLPILNLDGIKIEYNRDCAISVTLDCGVIVTMKGKSASVQVSNTYRGQLNGICGNMNGYSSDDYVTRSGVNVFYYYTTRWSSICNSWQVETSDSNSCKGPTYDTDVPADNQVTTHHCDLYTMADTIGLYACAIRLGRTAMDCYIKRCRYEMTSCYYNNAWSAALIQRKRCKIIKQLVHKCSCLGYYASGWRALAKCPMKCPAGMVYSAYTTGCQSTCIDVQKRRECASSTYGEGCVCPPGDVLSGHRCIPRHECGCLDENEVYRKRDERWTSANCSVSYVCTTKCIGYVWRVDRHVKKLVSHIVATTLPGCSANERCQISNDKYTCVQVCSGEQIWDECGSSCEKTCENPHPVCTLQCVPKCRCPNLYPILYNGRCIKEKWCKPVSGLQGRECFASGNIDYKTFDGVQMTFMGTCKYLLAASPEGHGIRYFRVLVQNQVKNDVDSGKLPVAITKYVEVHIPGYKILLRKNMRVVINGERVELPYRCISGVRITCERGGRLSMVIDCGVTIKIDGESNVMVRVADSYNGTMSGICGNMNNVEVDDYYLKDGTDVSTDTENRDRRVCESFRESGTEVETCSVLYPNDPANGAEVDLYCGHFNPNIDQTFAACLNAMGEYKWKKLYHQCKCTYEIYKGQLSKIKYNICRQISCLSSKCIYLGHDVPNWRNICNCPLYCPTGMVYKALVSNCPATCAEPDAETDCPDPDLRAGCVCPEGKIMSGSKCVDPTECGCVDANGRYRQRFESWLSSDCTVKSQCVPKDQGQYAVIISVRVDPCTLGYMCMLYNEKYQCRPSPHGACEPGEQMHCLSCSGVTSMAQCKEQGQFVACNQKEPICELRWRSNSCGVIDALDRKCQERASCYDNSFCAQGVCQFLWSYQGYLCNRCIFGVEWTTYKCVGIEKNECEDGTHNCDVNAICRDTKYSFTCTCKSGYTGNGETCEDIDECADGTYICDSNADCTNTPASYSCTCHNGYRGDGKSCLDINECLENTDNCHDKSICTNQDGGYDCQCESGFEGDGTSCIDLNECNLPIYPCYPGATCNNTHGSYYCECPSGYSGDGITCNDINECVIRTDDCDDKAICSNTQGSFTCICAKGFEMINGVCKDIDECKPTFPGSVCPTNSICRNVPGSYQCICNNGYYSTNGGQSCIDFDECIAGTHDCHSHAECTNNDGSFSCKCDLGFEGDGKTCENIDECATGSHNCDPNHATCQDTIGSFFCNCKPGFETSDVGVTCTDIDECDRQLHSCDNDNTVCNNLQGTYECQCKPGYMQMSSTKCTDINECTDSSLNECSTYAVCNNTKGSYSCVCISGYQGNGRVCTDVDECLVHEDDCDSSAVCTNTFGSYTCTCKSGFHGDGKNCDNIDECATNMFDCDQNAKCFDTIGSYNCKCNYGYSGDGKICTLTDIDCEVGYVQEGTACIDIDECDTQTDFCHYLATCQNSIGSYTCTCMEGYSGSGTVCSDIDECSLGTHTCTDREKCFNKMGSFTCRCKYGYERVEGICEDIDECAIGTHHCIESEICVNLNATYECICKAGFKMQSGYCKDINECIENTHTCHLHANCLNNYGSYTCDCKYGFTGNGQLCTNINECTEVSMICGYHARCIDTQGSYTCVCKTGYTKSSSGCADIDECEMNTNYCSTNAHCTNTPGSYSCSCKIGYEGSGYQCDDINECNTGVAICHTHSHCSNTDGSYVCDCKVGYTGNGVSCSDVNECLDNTHTCHGRATCTNLPGTYSCQCNPGYRGTGDHCYDINECYEDHNCSDRSNCLNTDGSFTCICKSGYCGELCQDINECVDNSHNCDVNSDCINLVGSYRCDCRTGYRGNGLTCYDIDECNENIDICGVNSVCQNSIGSYSCTCNSGFYSPNGVNCQDINECHANTHSCQANSYCQNNQGGYTCVCNNGYEMDANGICQDVDECAYGQSTDCSPNANCVNTGGSYDCVCKDGYSGDGKVCDIIPVDECVLGSHTCSPNAMCIDTMESYMCKCNPGYIGDGLVCDDINECQATGHGCHSNANCVNSPGSFKCVCNEGYTGDGISCDRILVDECTEGIHNCDVNADCMDTIDKFTCECRVGYTGSGTVCSDANECLEDRCDSNATCSNNIGSFVCVCNTGYIGDGFICAPVVASTTPVINTRITEGTQIDIGTTWGMSCVPGCHVMATCTDYKCVCNSGYEGDGVTTCTEIPLCLCRLRGDPLLETFDGQWLMVIGQDKYTMVKYMDPMDECSFNVEMKMQLIISSSPDKTYPDFLDIEVYNLKIRISNNLIVTVGSAVVTLPSVNQLHSGLSLTLESGYVVVETACGLRVAFNGKSTETAGTVTVPPRYADKVYGMCGDCDGLQNDLVLLNGTDVTNHSDKYRLISQSYTVDQSDSTFLNP